MDWWNDFIDWTSSDTGWHVISGALIPFVAIIVAGVVAALIGRGATKRVVALHEREAKNAAVAAIISAARKAATWGSLGHDERNYADHLAEDADIRLRLLPVAGAPTAANWAQHEIADIKKNSSTFSFQADQSLAEFRDRLLEWQSRPGRARKLFKSDLERWKFESPDPDADLIKRQQDWSADQADSKRASEQPPTPTPAAPTPTTTSLRAPQRTGGPTASATQPASATSASTAPAAVGGTAAAVARANAGSSTDPNAPISDGETRSYGDGVTRPYGDDQVTPVRPALGTPSSSTPASAGPAWTMPASSSSTPSSPSSPSASSGSSAWSGSSSSSSSSASSASSASSSDADNTDVVDDTVTPERLAELRGEGQQGGRVDPTDTANTTSVPTRFADAPAEPTDSDETSEATHTQPISANELRRRSEDDE